MLIVTVIVLALCATLIAYIFTRPSVPKKYPIFGLHDSIENHYGEIIGQLRTVASDSLSLYSTYNAEAFAQIIQNMTTKLSGLLTELDTFDAYWRRFASFKAQVKFVDVCRSYAAQRRQQVASAQQFMEDAGPFMIITDSLKRLKQAATNLSVTPYGSSDSDQLAMIQTQTQKLHDDAQALQLHHPVTLQYQRYIVGFLDDQLHLLHNALRISENEAQATETYNQYMDSWSHLNDTHATDLIYNEFSWQTDAYEQTMEELRRQTDYEK